MEQDAIATIQKLRAAFFHEPSQGKLEEPAKIMHDILRGYHGNAKLRLEALVPALGSTMRTLEREFLARYDETMAGFHERMRLEHAQMQIRNKPDIKLTAVASELGYDRENEFRRFFLRKTGESPSTFANRMRNG
jgi:transcriptional regulator GlxA family with amidase domain